MALIASLIGVPPFASPIRKRQMSLPTTLMSSTNYTKLLTPATDLLQTPAANQETSATKTFDQSPSSYHQHVIANRLLNYSSNTAHSRSEEQQLLGKEQEELEMETPDKIGKSLSFHVKYINNTERVILPITDSSYSSSDLFDSPVKILPPLDTEAIKIQLTSAESEEHKEYEDSNESLNDESHDSSLLSDGLKALTDVPQVDLLSGNNELKNLSTNQDGFSSSGQDSTSLTQDCANLSIDEVNKDSGPDHEELFLTKSDVNQNQTTDQTITDSVSTDHNQMVNTDQVNTDFNNYRGQIV